MLLEEKIIQTCVKLAKAFFLFLLVYSGYLIFIISLPINISILSLCILLALMLGEFMQGMRIPRFLMESLTLVSALYVVFALTSLYTISDNFYITKLEKTILVFSSFATAALLVRDRQTIRYFLFFLNSLCLGYAAFVFYLYDNNMVQFLQDQEGVFENIPDYLGLGQLLVCGVLVNLDKNSLLAWAFKLFLIAALILLGARGPFIFLILVLFLHYLSQIHWGYIHIKRSVIILLSLPVLVWFFLTWEGTTSLIERLSVVSQSNQDNESLLKRLHEWNASFEVIEERPLTGIGFGGFKRYVYGTDGPGHPHNLFLEIFMENGLAGFVILVFIFLLLLPILQSNITSRLPYGAAFSFSFIFLFFEAMKSSSIFEHKALFGFMGMCYAVYTINKNNTQKSSNLKRIVCQ